MDKHNKQKISKNTVKLKFSRTSAYNIIQKQNSQSSRAHMEHSPKYATFLAIKHTLKHLTEYK